MDAVVNDHDGLLVDLDGTLYRGGAAIDGAADVLASVAVRALLLTNNASRLPHEVADHMRAIGFAIDPADVVTSAHAAARLLGRELPGGARVLVIGTRALATEIANVGLRPVCSQHDAPAAVAQGHSPQTDWSLLAEGSLAIRAGAMWVACNADVTFPTERGLVPGNGAMVAALRAATGSEPVVVGKPLPHMFRDGIERGRFQSPLVVGDRLETDIAGATAAGLPSLLVLSGVSSASDVVYADPDCRPTYVAEDIRGLTKPGDTLRISPQPGWHVEIGQTRVTVASVNGERSEGLSIVRAVAHGVRQIDADGCRPELAAADEHARRALQAWKLIDG